ncbi:MAG: PTS transporter subunit EIIA, partial [Deltaproteobacteria bacterium]|nr:PTS transporter subunit EIIA [Deltaproteobacteria bacterium]
MEISNCLSESDISLEVDGRDKPEILKNLVDVFTKSTPLDNKTEVLNLLLEREKLKTTGIGSGV